ncbi:MAG: NADPH-dependent glutamate synthase [Candidatus Omnitrophica bacterium]|nr:NADPH-dependent glutamate synthase [Candidatus Omnitrophota bacterium]
MKNKISPRQLPAKERINNFQEVVFGYNKEQAVSEAKRCLQCKDPKCISGCPVGINIKKFISQIAASDFKAAFYTLKEKNNFPSICGRVCPAEYQCRNACVFTKQGANCAAEDSINIHFLERFVGDYGIKHQLQLPTQVNPKLTKYQVAVVGSGPAGLCIAGELARVEIKVTIFESLHQSGGVLRYGIPSFRLPRDILDYEINYLKNIGVEIIQNTVVGRTKTLEELKKEFSAVFLGLGAGVPSFLGIKGENLANVYSANEFLTRVNLMQADKFPQYQTPVNIGKNIVVIGGGNTAIDSARVALRMQAINGIKPSVSVLYRRTEQEMPARRLEIIHAKEEGIDFKFLTQPIKLISDKQGFVKEVENLNCELGKPDSSGRRRPIAQEKSNFKLKADLAIVAIGLRPNRLLTSLTPSLETDKWGDIVVNEKMETSLPDIYAGGDIVGGEGTIIEAFGMAKKAAQSIIEKFLDI